MKKHSCIICWNHIALFFPAYENRKTYTDELKAQNIIITTPKIRRGNLLLRPQLARRCSGTV